MPLAPPKQLYHPSVVVNLRIRFDEALNVVQTQQPDPESVIDLVTGRLDSPTPLSRPLFLDGAGDKLSHVVGRQPLNMSVEKNGYRQAGTFDMVLDWRDLPIDPRAIRAIGVEVYMGVVSPQDFAAGITKADPDGRRRSIIDITRRKPLLVGVADTGSVEFNEDGTCRVHISGRDLRGLLLDAKVDPRIFENLDLKKNIVNVVQQIISKHPYGQNIVVDANPDDWNTLQPGEFGPEQPQPVSGSTVSVPSNLGAAAIGAGAAAAVAQAVSILYATNIPSPGTKDGITRVRRGADGQTSTSAPPAAGEKISFWDLITRYCFLVGAIPYFVGETLRIRPSRSLYDYTKPTYDPRIPTPFANGQPRVIDDGNPAQKKPIKIRRFVWGRNLKTLKYERKFAGTKVPTIEVISVDTGSKARGAGKLIKGRWPDNTSVDPKKNKIVAKAKTTGVAPSGKSADTDVLRIPVAGLSSAAAAQQIAKNIYEEVGRGEMGGSASTKDLASFGGDYTDPDMLWMEPGDPVEVATDIRALSSKAPLVHTVVDNARRSYEEAVQEVTNRVGDANMARVLVATARGLIVELQSVFRVNTVKYSFAGGATPSVGIDFDFQNYVEARADVGPAMGPNVSAPGKVSTPKAAKAGGA